MTHFGDERDGRSRPSWSEWALDMAVTASRRSQDPYVQVGAVLMRRDGSIASIGYNGAPPGVDIDWSDRDARRPLVMHAEQNALRYTSPADFAAGGMAAVTMRPCVACLVALRSHGISYVVYRDELTDNYDRQQAAEVERALGMAVTR